MRGRSRSPAYARGRSNSPSRVRGRSMSQERLRGRSTSQERFRGRSRSPGEQHSRGRSSSGERGSFRRGGRRPGSDRRSMFRNSARKGFQQSFRRIVPDENCPRWKILSYIFAILILIGSSVGLIIVTGSVSKFTPGFLDNLIPTLNNDDLKDPNSGGSIGKWDTGESDGLELEILNALGDSWQIYFSLAIADWDYGYPDAVTLTATTVSEEVDCSSVTGKVKVCAGDYGETSWRGLCDLLYDGSGFIISTTARMNEYYLEFAEDDAKQYTMCHELGHSLGLAHTDENFYNADLGNCLDYTENFAVNKHPDESNYETLLEYYGPAGRRHLKRRQQRTDAQQLLDSQVEVRRRDEIRRFLEAEESPEGWKLVRQSERGEEHEMELDNGYKVRVHKLLA
eukprot:Nitzschia sp. Nitz4//scaffold2_size372955//253667//255113//NITZ4_000448-RA/size372955-processed-gene-0.439-mRNA-1//1//CDS//3329546853//4086//frame0